MLLTKYFSMITDKTHMVVNVRNLLVILLLSCFEVVVSCSGTPVPPHRSPAQTGSCTQDFNELLKKFQSRLGLEKAKELTRPGQLTYGKPRVEYLRAKIRDWDFDEIQEYIDARPIPYVRNPNGKLVIHDRHHFLLAFFKEYEDLQDRFPNQTLEFTYQRSKDFKGGSWVQYRQYMENNNFVNLKFKGRKVGWDDLPNDLLKLKKDYFRGMAWVLVKSGIVEKNPVPFFEFIWADFLRKRFPKLPRKWRIENIETVMKDILESPQDYKSMPGLEHKLPSLEDSLDEIDKYADELNW